MQSESDSSAIFKDYFGMKVWEQRHLKVSQIIQKYQIKRVLDIACAQATFIQRLSRDKSIQLLVGVDIDPDTISKAQMNARPQLIQNDIKFYRQYPLQVILYEGDATIPCQRLKQHNFELISMIQFIEHLKPDIIPKLQETIFKYMKTQYVIITTPNYQFNYHFQDLQDVQDINLNINKQAFQKNQQKKQKWSLRHWDHKFQWTRAQFKQFCQRIEREYGYQFEIFGVGEHIEDATKGYCSQGALFKLNSVDKGNLNLKIFSKQQNLKTVYRQIYPFWKNSYQQDLRKTIFIQIGYKKMKLGTLLSKLHTNKLYKFILQMEQKQTLQKKDLQHILAKYDQIQYNDTFLWRKINKQKKLNDFESESQQSSMQCQQSEQASLCETPYYQQLQYKSFDY